MSWTTEITINNKTSQNCTCRIKKGQIFENKKIGTGLQNVAAARDYTVEIPPNSIISVNIEVLCINQQLASPKGSLNATNYFIGRDFSDQASLWSIMQP